MAGAQFPGTGHECADVLGQTTAAESQPRIEELSADARVVAQCVGQKVDIGIGGFAHFGDGVDE